VGRGGLENNLDLELGELDLVQRHGGALGGLLLLVGLRRGCLLLHLRLDRVLALCGELALRVGGWPDQLRVKASCIFLSRPSSSTATTWLFLPCGGSCG